jgi:hypothetical protein
MGVIILVIYQKTMVFLWQHYVIQVKVLGGVCKPVARAFLFG